MRVPLDTVVRTWQLVSEASGRNDKVARLVDCLQAVPAAEVPIVVAWLSGELRQTRTGIGPAAVSRALKTDPAERSSLDVGEVDDAFTALAAISGSGSARRRSDVLGGLFTRATADERRFLARLLSGGLRQGALEGLMAEAIARAASVPIRQVRKALMFSNDAGAVAQAAFERGAQGVAAFGLRLFHPVQPMLAGTADDVEDALNRLKRAAFEYKIDGARIQVHRTDDRVRVYSRGRNDVTASVPEVVEAVRRMPVRQLVLDGEAIALRRDGSPLPFQVTMRQFGRTRDAEALRPDIPLSGFFFDCLHVDGETLLDRPWSRRVELLDAVVPAALRVPRLLTREITEATDFLARALETGHEGLMAKKIDSVYAAGARGAAWLKIKQANTLDLVVLAAEWGSGRRRGRLSNLHLGARDPRSGEFIMLGKTFKGLTDALLEWQTAQILAREVDRDAHTVYVRPELVVEIAFNEVQSSSRYPGGLALRFARVKAYRPDKSAAQADTIDTVRAFMVQPAVT